MDQIFLGRIKQHAAKINLLVVDDDHIFLNKMINELFRPLGFKSISQESDGRSGLMTFQRVKPRLVITDFDMPFMTGTDMINRIGADDKSVQFIVTTKYVTLKSVQHALREYIGNIKVFDKAVIRELLNNPDQSNQGFWNDFAGSMLWAQMNQ